MNFLTNLLTTLLPFLLFLPLSTSQSSGGALQLGDLPLPITLRMHTCSDCNCSAIWTQIYSDGSIAPGEKIFVGGNDPNIIRAVSGSRNLNSHEYLNVFRQAGDGNDPCGTSVVDLAKNSGSSDVGFFGAGEVLGVGEACGVFGV